MRFEVDPFEPDGIPHMITISPILELEEVRDFDMDIDFVPMLAPAIVDAVIARVRLYNGWSRQRILTRIAGMLNATNNVTNKTWDRLESLRNLTETTIYNIMDKITQSNDNIEVYNLDWTFTIDINSLLEGAGGTFPIPAWYFILF